MASATKALPGPTIIDTGANALGAQRHGGDRLNSAHAVDFIRPAEVHGGDHGRARLAMIRRRGRDHARHARDFRRHHAHVGGGHQRIFSARNVAADRVNRHVLVPENDSRQGLDFDVLQRRPLRLGEVAHLGLGELDVVDVALGELGQAALDLLLRKPERGWVPFVELLRNFAQSRLAATFDVFNNAGDDVADFLRLGGGLLGRAAGL